MHLPIFIYFAIPISVFCLLYSLDINAFFNEDAVLFVNFLNDEGKHSFSTEKCHISTTMLLIAQLDRFQSTNNSNEFNILCFN